ncbi:hypothetical protein C7H19_16965 [Aphanothece hegewaldii CCALA 016]|uniref:Tll0287-like domain-containing protein n=1 Tax=Aphanothece hegewaldii CCALA 016 TaxID=2107694 RepID=A0A2T1LUX3_9CHRO|nr:DUF3365 domain-containing protein [Aphanothece hegewaldii]PSF35251.1 hypothetical protein C7H19_16965 [Aphanothece hegewaldii CCALA 016]
MKVALKIVSLIAVALSVCWLVIACSGEPKVSQTALFSPDLMADYIYRILKSEREIYGKYVVQRLSETHSIQSSENWERDNALPLPAQVFRMGAELSSQKGSFNYGLISPWNLNENQAPKTEFEQKAMATVLETKLLYKGYQTKDGQKYFSVIYPDKAVTQACVDCHNNHPVHKQRYPDKVFQVGDVMGGILINLPIEE